MRETVKRLAQRLKPSRKKRGGRRFFHFYLGRELQHWHAIVWWILFLVVSSFGLLVVKRITGANLVEISLALSLSFRRIIIAYFFSLILGGGFAFLITMNERFENIAMPFFETAQSLPTTAITALLIVWFGNSLAVILLLILAMIWPIAFSVVSGIKTMKHSLMEAATIFGAVGRKRFSHFTLPMLLPSIITGSIIGWGEGWEVIVAAEVIGSLRGIGSLINDATRGGHYGIMGIGITGLIFVVFFSNKWIWVPLLKRTTKHHEL